MFFMEDRAIAKEILNTSDLSLVFVKKRELLFSSPSNGISGLLEAIKIRGETLRGSSLADKVVGRAAALLAVYSGVTSLYTPLLSEEGAKVLHEAGISLEYDRKVSCILNRTGSASCPLEEASLSFKTPAEAYSGLREFVESRNLPNK